MTKITDPRVKLLLRRRGATRFEVRAANGHTDGRAITPSGIKALARRHGFKLLQVGLDAKENVRYQLVAR